MKHKLFISVLFLIFSQSSFADLGIYAGGQLGLQMPSESTMKSRVGFGLDAGYMFDGTLIDGMKLSAGLNWLYSTKETVAATALTSAISTSISTIHINARAHVWEGLFLGLGLGQTLISSGITSIAGVSLGASYSPFSFAPEVGYDYKFMDNLTAGGYMNYVFVTESTDTIIGVVNTQKSFGILNVLASVKYWF